MNNCQSTCIIEIIIILSGEIYYVPIGLVGTKTIVVSTY